MSEPRCVEHPERPQAGCLWCKAVRLAQERDEACHEREAGFAVMKEALSNNSALRAERDALRARLEEAALLEAKIADARAEGAAQEREAIAQQLESVKLFRSGREVAEEVRARAEPSSEGSACSGCGHSQDLHRPACVGDGNECLCASFKPEGSAPAAPKCTTCNGTQWVGYEPCHCVPWVNLDAPKPDARELALEALEADEKYLSSNVPQDGWGILDRGADADREAALAKTRAAIAALTEGK